MKKLFIVSIAGLLAPFISMAHPGHGGTDGYTITHYFLEPDHAIFTWSFFMASFFLISFYKAKKRRSSK